MTSFVKLTTGGGLAAALLCLGPPAFATTAPLVGDSHTLSSSATANKGTSKSLEVSGPPDETAIKTAYLRFDLSTLPTAVTAADIAKATLTLFVNKVSDDGSFDVVHVTSAWTELGITAGSAPTLGAIEQSAVGVVASDKNQFKTVEVTNLVKAWRDGSLTNNGLALVANAVDGLNAKFDAKESTAHSQVPRLEITLSGAAGGGGVTNVSASSPLSVTNPTTTPNITLGTVPITLGGTNATSAATARTNLGAAGSGTNSDITSLSGLTVPLSVSQGGTGAATPFGARSVLGAAASGNNGDINSLTGITGNIEFFFQSTDASTGNIFKSGNRFLHNYNGGTFLGLNAGNFTLTGTNNTGLGAASLASLTSGSNNTAVGTNALINASSGINNTAIGAGALQTSSTGGFNTAVGRDSLFSLTSGIENTAVGYRTLRAVTTGGANTAVGNGALENNTANNNTAVGYLALLSNVTGGFNTALGVDSQRFVTSGGENTAVGYRALRNNTAAGQSTAVGAGALENSTGGSNTAVGYLALLNNTSGTSNIAVGNSAGSALTTGNGNIAIGNSGVAAEANTIRIGNAQTRAFLAGVRGVTTGVADAVPVVIDSNGQLGTGGGSASGVTVVRAAGPIGTSTTTPDWAFLGPQATVTLTAGQTVTGTMTAAIGKTTAATEAIKIDLCSQPTGGGPIVTLDSITANFLVIELDNGPRLGATVSSRGVFAAAGSYRVGFCVSSNGPDVTLNRNDYVSGWFLVTG